MTIYRGVGGSGDSATGEDVFGDNSSITSLNGISGVIQTPTYIKFAADANHTAAQGELTWNTAEGTLDLGLNHGGVVLQIGQELHYRVTNQSGSNIGNGVLVSFVGTTGNSGKLLVAKYNGTQASKSIIGLTTEPISNGATGYVTCFGKVRGIQTNGANYGETWVNGDILYPSPSGLTKVLPQAPAAKQPVAVVVNAHNSNGELFVRVQNGTTLAEDELVHLTSLTNGDVLQYDSTDGRFENRSLSAAGILATSAIGTTVQAYDVDTTKNDVANTFTQQQTIDNNLVFTGTGRRIIGDFSNATLSNRVSVQTSTVNGNTSLATLPNGTSKISNVRAFNNSDPTNAALIDIAATSTDNRLSSGITGTGTYLPITIYTGGSERMRIDTSGNVGIGTVSPTNSANYKFVTTSATTGAVYQAFGASSTDARVFAENAYGGTGMFSNHPFLFYTNSTERMRIDTSGNVLVTNAAGLGYGTGAGGTVTQATSKSTAVTLNKPTGNITMNNAALAASAAVVFTLNNSLITASDMVILTAVNFSAYRISVQNLGTGAVNIEVINKSGGSLSEAVVINFAIIKGATS